MNSVNTIITDYIKNNLSPKITEKNEIKEKYSKLSKILVGDNFQSGSYARFTSISPVNDLDVVWELPMEILKERFPKIFSVEKIIYPNHLDVKEIINDLSSKLKIEYNNVARIKPQTHSVGIYFGANDDDFSIDIVPAIPLQKKNEYGECLYLIPEISMLSKIKRSERYANKLEKIKWIKTDPRGYIKAAQKINEINDNFRKATKFIKMWKQNCKIENNNFKLKSFHIEQIIYDVVSKNSNHNCFQIISSFYFQLVARISGTSIPDRADGTIKIDEYINELSEVQKNKIKEKNLQALSLIDEIEETEDDSRLHDLIEKLLQKKEIKEDEKHEENQENLELLDISHCQNPIWPIIQTSCTVEIKCSAKNEKNLNIGEIKSDDRVMNDGWFLKYVADVNNMPNDSKIYWQVVNTGEDAKIDGGLRGNFFKGRDLSGTETNDQRINWEATKYKGKHWIECFIVNDDKLIARSGRFYVRIIPKRPKQKIPYWRRKYR